MSIKSLFDTYKALVVFDTETTGLNYTNDQIIELAALRVELDPQGEPIITKQMDTFISLPQGEKLPQRIVQLTGITDEVLEKDGFLPAIAAEQNLDLMQRRQIQQVMREKFSTFIAGMKSLRAV